MAANDLISDMLLEWEDRVEKGCPATAEELCRESPHIVGELRRRIDLLQALAPVLDLSVVAPAPPPQIPGFDILGVIGEGGMGIVYQARDLSLDWVVALKMPHDAAVDGAARRRFEREARLLAQLRHPNIVPVHRAELFRGRPFIVMDYLSGGSLAVRKERRMAPERAAALIEKVARAVDHAHANGALHRDLKPSNILINAQGEPLVSDFGVASLLGGDDQAAETSAPVAPHSADDTPKDWRLTRAGAVMGTPKYMAPEQFVDKASPASDIWAMGVILYELLTGQSPFDANRFEDAKRQVREVNPKEPRQIHREVDRQLSAITLKCLEKDAARRFPSAGALAEALARWRRRTISWRKCRRASHAALGILSGALVALVFMWPVSDEARHRKKIQPVIEQLDAGKGVELLGDTGMPISQLVRAGKAYTRVTVANDGVFSVYADGIALVELLPDPRFETFRFSVQVREDVCQGTADLGIYFAHQETTVNGGMAHVFGLLSFADLGPSAEEDRDEQGQARSNVFLKTLHVNDAWPRPRLTSEDSGTSRYYQPPPPAFRVPGPWRNVFVEVAPDQILAGFDDFRLQPLRTARMRWWVQQTLPNLAPEVHGKALDFPLRGGLGFYVRGCQASFRQCRVDPMEARTQ